MRDMSSSRVQSPSSSSYHPPSPPPPPPHSQPHPTNTSTANSMDEPEDIADSEPHMQDAAGEVDADDQYRTGGRRLMEAAEQGRGGRGGGVRFDSKRLRRKGNVYSSVSRDADGGLGDADGDDMLDDDDADGVDGRDMRDTVSAKAAAVANSGASSSTSTATRRVSSSPAAPPSPNSAPSPSSVSVSSVLIAGAGFMCDAYDLFIMNVLLVVMGCEYGNSTTDVCQLSSGDEASLASAVVIGAIVGQLSFGVLADYLGRRRGFILTLSLLIVGASLSAAAQDVGSLKLFVVLSLCRFILGVGVGGEYPLSATVSSEASVSSAGRGRRVSLVFSMQGVGLLAAPLTVLVLLVICGAGQYDTVWRVSLALGAVPGVVMIYFRFKMKETAAFSAARDASDSALDEERRTRSAAWLAHRWDLLATAGNWFIFDVVFYSNSLFSSQLTKQYVDKPSDSNDPAAVHQYLIQVASSTLYLALCALPGYYGAVLVIDRWGRRRLQLFGYFGMCVMYVVCGTVLATYPGTLPPGVFYLLYGLSFFFCNMGPNTTTFVIPSEIFPTAIRASAHGISAAAGKVGAAIGTALMPVIRDASSLPAVMFMSAAIAAAGLLFTLALTRESQHTDIMHLRVDERQAARDQHRQHEMHQHDGQQQQGGQADRPLDKSALQKALPSLSLSRAIRKARGYTDLLKQQSSIEEEEDEQDDGASNEEFCMDDESDNEEEQPAHTQQQQQHQQRVQRKDAQSVSKDERGMSDEHETPKSKQGSEVELAASV